MAGRKRGKIGYLIFLYVIIGIWELVSLFSLLPKGKEGLLTGLFTDLFEIYMNLVKSGFRGFKSDGINAPLWLLDFYYYLFIAQLVIRVLIFCGIKRPLGYHMLRLSFFVGMALLTLPIFLLNAGIGVAALIVYIIIMLINFSYFRRVKYFFYQEEDDII